MPPRGRRRLYDLLVLLSLLLLSIPTVSAASSAVLGIDLGTEYIKAALVKPGVPLDIVLTKDSKRKETAAVAFKRLRTPVKTAETDAFPERIYGGDALALSARFPKDVYPNLKPLLGLSRKTSVASEYGSLHPELQLVEFVETGTVGFKSDSFVSEEEPYLVEELLAMELKNIKGNAEIMAGKGYSVADVVITIPTFYTGEEKRAVIRAAELADLRVLSLVSDGLAVGLNYATSRTFPTVNEGGKPEINLVYDMGAGSTTATVLKFQGRTVKDVGKYNKTVQEVHVLGTSWDKTLGGDALNSVIIEDIINQFIAKPESKKSGLESDSIKSHGRTMAKLLKESERIRQVLSANTETYANFESFYHEDQHLKYKLSRNDFEKLASKYSSRVQAPILEALEAAKLTLADIDSVILHGGVVRTPFVQKKLEEVIENANKIKTNVNSDEAAVFGAGFKAAAISPSFRVKEIRASDNAVYPIFASWTTEGKDKQQKLFVPTSQVGAEKQVTFKATGDFEFDLFQQVPKPATDLPMRHVSTRNLTESVKALMNRAGCTTGDISTKFAIRLSPTDGLPEVVSGSISCEGNEVEKKGVVDGMKDFLGFGSKKDDQQPLEGEIDSGSTSSAVKSDTSTTASNAESMTLEASLEASTKAAEKTKDAKKKAMAISIAFTSEIASSSSIKPDGLARIKKRLAAFDASDRSRALREETLNNLEGYTYKIRDILEDEAIITASTSAQRDDIKQKADDASAWLYGEGAEADRDKLKARLDDLRSLVKPIQKRKDEAAKRPDAVKQLQDGISQAKTMVSVIKQQQEAQLVAESASSTSESSSTTAITTSASDDFADLDDEPVASAVTATAKPDIPLPLYSEADLAAIIAKQESAQTWLDERAAKQEKLSPTDDPVLLSSDLSARTKELNEMVTNLLIKQINAPKPKKAKASTTTVKTKSSSSKTSQSLSSSSMVAEAEPSSTEGAEAEPSPAQDATTESPTDVATAGNWVEGAPPEPEPGQGMPSPEEEMRMRKIQQEIDEQLAAEKSSVVAKNKATNKKEKKAHATAKVKSQGKGSEKLKGREKERKGHEEL
ncbi:MAG: hypothetical protein Q9164_002222 [Protoblastenia rupestris]